MSDTAVHQDLALAAEFPATDRADWVRLVEKALKDRPFDRLISKTYDGIAIEPLYARAAGAAAVRGRTSGQPWTVMQRIDHPDPTAANKQALDDLQNGASGLTLIFAGSLNANGYGLPATPDALKQTLDGIALDAITIDLNLSPATRQAVQLIADLVKSRSLSPDTVDLRASINPIGGYAASGATPAPWSELSKRMAGMIRALAEQGYRGPFAVADGRIVHNAGGSEAQELAFALAAAVDCLRALDAAGVPLDQARSMIYFRLAADADQFLTIAKFRAIRKLWARAEEACGLAPRRATVAAETAWRMLTQRDPYVNMLRTTIAVTAAGVGGADNIAVLPHTAAIGLPDAFARRVARNTQLVLLEEANLAKVADPAAGSGAIEHLTDALCASAWALFQIYDKAGGAWAALEQGMIQRDVATVREKRQAVERGLPERVVDRVVAQRALAPACAEPLSEFREHGLMQPLVDLFLPRGENAAAYRHAGEEVEAVQRGEKAGLLRDRTADFHDGQRVRFGRRAAGGGRQDTPAGPISDAVTLLVTTYRSWAACNRTNRTPYPSITARACRTSDIQKSRFSTCPASWCGLRLTKRDS